MKIALATIALALLLTQCFAASGPRVGRRVPRQSPATCTGAADTSCNAYSFLEILVTAGSCKGTASADCSAVSESTSAFEEAFNEWWGDEGLCDSGKAEAAATAVATAVAKVWSNAAVKVNCEGLGFACGWSIANGNTFAVAFAEAVAQAAAEAGVGVEADSFCFADIRALSTVFATAAAQAQADACTTGGTVEDFEDSYVKAVQVGIATAFAEATASACSESGEVSASSKCTGEATSSTEENIIIAGDVCGGLSQIPACTGEIKEKCCADSYRRNLCTCKDCNGPWFRRTREGDAKKTFANRQGNLCFCTDTADDGVDEDEEEVKFTLEPKKPVASPPVAEIPVLAPQAPAPQTIMPQAEVMIPESDSSLEETVAPSPMFAEDEEAEAPTDMEIAQSPFSAAAEDAEDADLEEDIVDEIEADVAKSLGDLPETPMEESMPAVVPAVVTVGEQKLVGDMEEPKAEEPMTMEAPEVVAEQPAKEVAEPEVVVEEPAVVEAPKEVPETKSVAVSEQSKKVSCPGAVDTTCSAFASLEILVTAGKCSGTASADCRAVSESQNDFQEAFDDWWGDNGVCDSGKAEAASTAVAKAIAKVWANAAVKVTCEGLGFACGWSVADGATWSIAFAEALAQASAEASSGGAEGFCYADIRSIATVVAEAASQAQADACTTGGTAEDFEASFAAAIQVGIANAFARATARTCNEDGEAIASSLCVGEAASRTEGDNFAVGNACAGIAQVTACEGPGKEMCCDSGFRRTLCVCNRNGCANGPWKRQTDFDPENNTKRSFVDRKQNVCFCLD